ncbi:AraC family transcriptional regulator [Neorhizobium galegae]|uniref:helix-turn-helix transcriptional regulator n=1 Tax=Neorhizobium galegae TaxID=399 RepID=UPI002101581C|nr:AraC family transcriptional regulator [Neorhizobium galegae]MCQ1574643.1 AraC family transcriptional regulator [Neorhizobium galegae]
MRADLGGKEPRTSCGTGPEKADGLAENVRTELLVRLRAARLALRQDSCAAEMHVDAAVSLCSASLSRNMAGDPNSACLTCPQIAAVHRELNSRLADRIKIRLLAEAANLSPERFMGAFSATFNTTPRAYIRSHRLCLARQLVELTDLPLHRIASLCGLLDQPHFSNVFKKRYGLPPSAWRRKHRPVAIGMALPVSRAQWAGTPHPREVKADG